MKALTQTRTHNQRQGTLLKGDERSKSFGGERFVFLLLLETGLTGAWAGLETRLQSPPLSAREQRHAHMVLPGWRRQEAGGRPLS